MRTHGWAGDPPADDEEAVRRILDATRAVIEVKRADTGLADVARALGVTRQTVYRYFAGTEALLVATAYDAAGEFLELIAGRLRGIRDAATAVVEGIALTVEELPNQPYVGLLLTPPHVGAFSAAVTSDVAMAFGRDMLERFDVDWRDAGLDDDDLAELAELMLRTVQSFVVDPGRPPRRGEDLRRYLHRWVVPAVLAGTRV